MTGTVTEIIHGEPSSIIETHLGKQPFEEAKPLTTRDDLEQIVGQYRQTAPAEVVDMLLDRLYQVALGRSGWAQLLIRGVKDGKY